MKDSTLGAGGMFAALALSATSLGAAPAPDHHGQQADDETLVELMRKDVRASKADIVAKTMELDAEQAAAFWPVYKKYEAERPRRATFAVPRRHAHEHAFSRRLTGSRAKPRFLNERLIK